MEALPSPSTFEVFTLLHGLPYDTRQDTGGADYPEKTEINWRKTVIYSTQGVTAGRCAVLKEKGAWLIGAAATQIRKITSLFPSFCLRASTFDKTRKGKVIYAGVHIIGSTALVILGVCM